MPNYDFTPAFVLISEIIASLSNFFINFSYNTQNRLTKSHIHTHVVSIRLRYQKSPHNLDEYVGVLTWE